MGGLRVTGANRKGGIASNPCRYYLCHVAPVFCDCCPCAGGSSVRCFTCCRAGFSRSARRSAALKAELVAEHGFDAASLDATFAKSGA